MNMIAALIPKAMNDWGEKIRKFITSQEGLEVDDSRFDSVAVRGSKANKIDAS